MLMVRKEQLETFRESRVEAFGLRLVQRVIEEHPQRAGELGHEQVDAVVAECREAATAAGFDTMEDVARVVVELFRSAWATSPQRQEALREVVLGLQARKVYERLQAVRGASRDDIDE